jgi:hypothetical protein
LTFSSLSLIVLSSVEMVDTTIHSKGFNLSTPSIAIDRLLFGCLRILLIFLGPNLNTLVVQLELHSGI